MYSSDKIFIRVKIIPCFLYLSKLLLDVDFVSKESSNSSEAFYKLESLLALVCDKVKRSSESLIVITDPFSQGVGIHSLIVYSSLFMLEISRVLLLGWVKVQDLSISFDWVLDFQSLNLKILKEQELFERSSLQGLHCVVNSENNKASVLSYMLEESLDHSLLFYEFDV